MTTVATTKAQELLGAEAESLLTYQAKGFDKSTLHLPGPDFVDRVAGAIRPCAAGAAQLPVDPEHGPPRRHGLRLDPAGRPGHRALGRRELRADADLLRPREHRQARDRRRLQRVASTLGVLGSVSRKYAHKIPFMVKLNHNEFLSYPNNYDQIMFASVEQAFEMGAAAVGATIYFGSRRVDAADSGSVGGVRAGARARPGDGALVLHAQPRVQDREGGLPRLRRPHRSGQSPRRHHPGRHHQAEAAREQRRLQRPEASARRTSTSTPS